MTGMQNNLYCSGARVVGSPPLSILIYDIGNFCCGDSYYRTGYDCNSLQLLNNSMEQVLLEKIKSLGWSRNFPCLMEPRSSLLNPEPVESSPHSHILLPKIQFYHLHLCVPSGLFPSDFSNNILYAFVISTIHTN
jgi:hypothetical protein